MDDKPRVATDVEGGPAVNAKRLGGAVLLALGPAAGAAQGESGNCVRAAPAVRQVASSKIYSDAAGSVPDKAGLHKSYEQTMPIRKFVTQLSRLADGADRSDWKCGIAMLSDWAAGDALLETPATSQGKIERRRFMLAIDIAAIKLMRKAGSLPVSVVAWIRSVEEQIRSDFGRRHAADNLNAWSGVNAEVSALITHDPAASAYADVVWRDSLAQINAEGILPTEIKRAGRALHYHEYYASALFMLRAARRGAGKPTIEAEERKLRVLATRIDKELCAAPTLRAKTGVAQQTPGVNNIPVGLAFGAGLPVDRWKNCAAGAWSFDVPMFGGDVRAAAAAIASGSR